MTTVATMPAAALPIGDRFRSSRVFGTVVALTATVAVAGAMTSELPIAASVALVVVAVTVFGLPHGAVDHLAHAATSVPSSGGAPSQLGFHLAYLGAMAAYALVWLVAPSIALAGFLVMSVHHFGQSDLAYLRLPTVPQLVLQWSRGVFIVALPLVAHLSIVAPLIDRLGGGDPSSWRWLSDRWQWWAGAIVVQHLLIGTVVARRHRRRTDARREIVAVITLGAVFMAADPLIGFVVYFTLWHSLAHLFVLAEVLGRSSASGVGGLTVGRFARLVAPRVSLAAIAVGGSVATAVAIDRLDLALPAMFVIVSVLTVPHLFVVERLWRCRPHHTESGVGRSRGAEDATCSTASTSSRTENGLARKRLRGTDAT